MTVLPSTDGVTRWRQIAESLSREIEDARFADGRLPTEPELALRFGVNRHTIRRAIGVLASEGLVRVEQGRGTFVADGHIDYVIGRRTRFAANLQREGREAGHRLLSHTHEEADPATAQALCLAPGTAVIAIQTLGKADGVPVTYATHFFPAEQFALVPEIVAATSSITAALAACGVADYTRAVTRLLARMPTASEAQYLEQPLQRPVLQAESINVDGDGRPIQRSLTVFAGDRVQAVVAPDER